MAKRKTFDEILQERYGSSEDESTGVNDRSYDDIMLERRLSGKESDKWTSDMTKAFNQGNRYSKQAYEGAVEIAKNSRRVKTGAERYGLFSGGNEELNKGILHKASNYIKSKIDDGKSEITEEESLKHASNVLAGVSEDNQALLKKYVDAQDSSKSTPFLYLMNTDSPVMQKQQMKDSETMDAVKKQFMEKTGVDEKTFNKMVANYGYTYHADENEKQKKELQQSSGTTKALASAVDILASPATGFVALVGTGKNQVDQKLGRDNHTVYSSLKDFSENTEEAVLNDTEKIDNKALRTAAKGAYEVGMATGKSAMSMMTGSEAASALGLTGKSARAVANLVSLPQFGASSYVSTLEEAQERGLDTKDAYRTALVAGGAEMATEVISLEGIWDILESKGKVAAKTAIGNILKQSFFEGSEEVANDLINEIADGLINGDKSKYVQSVRYYMSDQYAKENGLDAPLSEDEAKKKANIDFAKSTAIDGFLGAASGGLMGGAATAINAYANTKGGQYLSGNEQIRDDIVLNKDSENYISDDRADYDSEEDYQKAQSAIEQLIDDSSENISGKEARSLYQNVAEAISSQNSNRAEARVQREVETIENAQTPDELVRATESVKNDVPEVQQAIENTKARMVAQGATQADFDNVVTPTRAYEMAKRGQVSESDLASMSTDARRAAEAGISESVSADIKNVTKFDASTVLVKENGKAKQTNITGEVTKSGDQYYLTTKKGAKVELSEDILSGTTKANGDNTKGKLLMYGNSHAAGIISLEDPNLMTIALQTKINQPSVPSTSIVKAVKTFNTLGHSGVSFESIVNDKKQKFMVDAIGEKVLRQAYDLGAKEGALDEEKMANPTTKKGSGRVSFASREAEGAYEKLDQANKTFLDKFAEKTGVDFELFTDDADAEGTVRGQYVPEEGKIRLNVAEDTDILEVAMHEGIGEFLKAHNAKGYAEITETILDYYAENNADALAKRIEDYKRAYSDEEGKSTRGSADELVNDVLAEIFSDDAGIEKLGTWLFDNGKEKEAKTIKDVLIDFINQMKSWIADIKAQGGLSAAERSKLSMEEKDMDALQNRILKAMDEAIANRDSRAEGETAEQSIRNSVKVDANGKQYVEIDEDIIKGITGSKNIKSAVRAYIKENYPSIDMMGFKLGVNAKSRNEFVNSKTSQYMQNKLKRFFIDKMRMAGNLEEIVNVGDGYTWEDIKHSRKDKLIGFVRGNVQIRVGSNDYIADIVLADDKTKGLIFYDIVNMKSTAIKEAPTERTHENHAAQVAGASTDSISQNEKNATRKSVKVDSDGRKLSEGQQEYFKNTKVLDDNGNLMVVYHGSPSKFNVFDAERIGTRASAEGYGFYFTDSREKAEGYHEKDGNLMKGYLDIQKPLSLDEVTIKRSEVKKLLENIDPTGDDVLSNYDASGVGYPSRAWYNNAMRDALDMIMENENDADIIAEIANNYGSMSNNIVESTDTGKKAVKEAVDKQTEKLRKEMQQYKKTIRASYQDQVTRYKTELERTQKDLRAVQNNLKNWKPVPETQILNQAELDAKAEQMATKALTDYKMAQERSKQIDNIKRTGHRMIRWLDAPTDKQHVPEFLQRPLSEFLSSVDFLPLRAKETSKNTLDWRHQMMVLKDVIARLKESDPEIDSDGYALSQVLVVDELVEKMQNILDNNQDVNMKVSKLPAGDLKEMSEVLSSLSAAINHMNTTYANSRYAGIGDLARASIREMQERKPTKTEKLKIGDKEVGEAVFKFFNLDEIEPLTFFEGLGSASASVYQELRQGFDIRTNHIRETADFFEKKKRELGISDKEMAEWGKEQHEFHFPGGDITMTTPQIMSLLETVNRKQGKPHVEAGGIKIADTEVKRGKVKKSLHMTKAIHIDEAQYETIISKLTPKQRAMANELQHYMATECANWGNRVSREMYGYKKFTEKDYFPLRTDSTTLETKPSDDQAPSYYTIKNRSFTKQITPHAANAVVIDDIFDVFTRHVVQMAEYDGYTMPIADAMRWYNYQEKEINTIRNQDLLGEVAGDTTNARNEIKNSVKQNMDRVLGKKAGAYFQQFIKDINGDYAGTGGTPELSNILMGNFKAQAVMANMRVVVQQPTAIVRAADRIEAKYLLQAQTALPKAVEYAKKSQMNSAISYWKSQGYYETLIGKSLKQIITGEATFKEKLNNKAGALAGIADDLTWGIMYRAAELKVMDQHPNLKYNSEEFTKKTVEIFEDIIDHTQVVDTIFHKSQWMRNQGLGYRTSSAFMAEPTKTYNMFYRAYQDCLRSGNKQEMVNRAGRTAMIFLVEQALNAAVTGFIDAWRDDDKDEGIIGFLQSEADHTKENFIENLYVWNLLPMVKDTQQIVEDLINGYSSTTDYTTAGISAVVRTLGELVKVATGTSNKTVYGVSYLIAQGISQLYGSPIASALREVKSFYNTLNGLWGGTDWYKTTTQQNTAEKRKRQTALNNAIQKKDLEDSKDAMNKIYQEAYDNGIENGKSKNEAESDAWSSVRSALKKSYQEQEDRSTATINRYVTLMRKTKKKVSGKNEFKAVTEKDARDTVKGW